MEIEFSIIVPVFNVAPYLRECLDSIVAQTCSNWEAICIDDGSKDGSGEILDEYAARDSRFRIIHQLNSGVGAARNLALDMARGNWIGFLDADDVVSPYLLSSCEMYAKSNNQMDVFRFELVHFVMATELKWLHAGFHQMRFHNQECLGVLMDNSICFCMQMYRRGVIANVRFPKRVYAEDPVFAYDAIRHASLIGLAAAPLYGYRIRAGSVTQSALTYQKLEDFIYCVGRVFVTMRDSSCSFSSIAIRQNCNKITEEFFELLVRARLPLRERRLLIRQWRRKLKLLLKMDFVRGFQRLRMQLLAFSFLPCVAWVFCMLPMVLKRRGIHR